MPQGGLEKTRPNKTPGVSIWQQRVARYVYLEKLRGPTDIRKISSIKCIPDIQISGYKNKKWPNLTVQANGSDMENSGHFRLALMTFENFIRGLWFVLVFPYFGAQIFINKLKEKGVI